MAPGRNAPCPCGSGKKYKRCCEKKGDIRVRRRFWIALAVGIPVTIGIAAVVSYYSTPQYGAAAAVVGLAVVGGYLILRNPPKSRGRDGADRIDFGR
ncbi:MAG: SEC-C metal-binding domain-containing protein [Myxococcota bacterium]